MELETVPYRPAKLKPVTSPQELRELTARDYASKAARMGLPLSAAEADRLAVVDLHMADAYERGVDLSPKRKGPRPKPKADVRLDLADDLPFKKPTGIRERPEDVEAEMLRMSARWPYAKGRIARILEGAQPSRDPIMVAMSCAYPEMALRVLRLHRNYLMRGQRSRHNPFYGLSEIDARRALVRFTEDICDASSARMGPWWVPR